MKKAPFLVRWHFVFSIVMAVVHLKNFALIWKADFF